MSTRERWTVYPLLFLALGIAIKDKVTREVFTDRMVCKELYVTDRAGLVRLAADPSPAGGLLKIQGTDGQGLALGFSDKLLGLMFIDQAGRIGPPSVLRPTRPARPPAHQGRSK